MKVIELKKEMDGQFAGVDARFKQVDARFEQVDARFERVEAKLEAVLQRVILEGETTRRHFDIVSERMQAELRLGLDVSTATNERLEALRSANAREHAQFDRRLMEHDVRLGRLDGN